MSWTDDIHEELHELDAQGLRRRLRTVDLLGGMRASVEPIIIWGWPIIRMF